MAASADDDDARHEHDDAAWGLGATAPMQKLGPAITTVLITVECLPHVN